MKRIRGDRAINRAAASGRCTYLFQGRRWLLEPGNLYGTRLDRETGKRRIVVLFQG